MKAKNSKGIFSALVPVLRYVASSSWSFMLLLLAGACNGHSPRVAIEAAGLEQVDIQAQAQVLESEVKEEASSAYLFGDNALDFKLGKSSRVEGREILLLLAISVGDKKTYINLDTKYISRTSLTHGRYDNDKALGLLEDNNYMDALWQALLGDEGNEKIRHVRVATDLLNNSSDYITRDTQKEAALILETLVMLLRPSLRDTFIDYLKAVSKGESQLSTDDMDTFFSERIPEKDHQYKFGDNVVDEYQRWSCLQISGKEISSRHRKALTARHHNYAPFIGMQLMDPEYTSIIDCLVPSRPVSDAGQGHRASRRKVMPDTLNPEIAAQIAQHLLENNNSDWEQKQLQGAAMLEAIVGLAEEWRKQGASKLFRGCLRAIEAQEPGFNFNILAQADQGNIQPTEDSKQADQFRQCFKFAHAARKKRSTNYPEGLPSTAEKFGLLALSGPKHGRRQIARIQCMKKEKIKFDNREEGNRYEELKKRLLENFPEERTLLFGNEGEGYLSSGDDYDSDEDTRLRKGNEKTSKGNPVNRGIFFTDIDDLFSKAGKQTGENKPSSSGPSSGS